MDASLDKENCLIPASVTLFRKGILDPVHVSPLRWSYEDAGIPYEPFIGRFDAYDCIEYYPDEYGFFDGYLDLSFKFKTQEVVAALGDVYDGNVVIVQLAGNLKPEYGGTSFVGEDVVLILANTNGLWFNFYQLCQGILKSSGDRYRAAQRHIHVWQFC